MANPVSVLCIYRVKAGKEAEFRALLDKHWPTLARLGLVTAEKHKIWESQSSEGQTVYVEMFQWRDAQAVDEAHQSPELMQVWEPMGTLTDEMEFLDVAQIRAGEA